MYTGADGTRMSAASGAGSGVRRSFGGGNSMSIVGAQGWHVGEVFLAMLWLFLLIIWIWPLISVFADVFRSHDMGGLAKALWVIFVIIFPFLGVFVYLIARGGKMAEHSAKAAADQD